MIKKDMKCKKKLRSTVFKKGNIPWNKNLKGIHLSPGSEFKKGHKPITQLPLKSITIRIDNNGRKRKWIKIAEPKKWIKNARFVWIKYNGKIPKDYLIHHTNENTLNDNIKNLDCLTRKEHLDIHRESIRKKLK